VIDTRPNHPTVQGRALDAILWTFEKVNKASRLARASIGMAQGTWYFIKKLWEADQAVREAQQRREERLRQAPPQAYSGGLRPKA
jgi:hypothetical protein